MKSHFHYLPLLLALLFCCGSCKDSKTSAQKAKEKDAIEDLERSLDTIKAQRAKELEENGELSGDPASLDRVIDASKKLEAASTGDEAKGAKVMRLFMVEMKQEMAKLAAAQEHLLLATDYSKVETAEDIDALSAKAKIYQKVNSELTTKIKSGWGASVRKDLEKEGVSQSYINNFIAGFENGMNTKTLLIIRETDDEVCVALLKQHEILKKHLGKWQWNATTELPEFEDDATLESYNDLALQMEKASAKQLAAQKKLIKAK